MKHKLRKRILIGIVVVVLGILAALSVGALAYAQANNGVITTNFPTTGGTIASPPFRIFPNISYGDYSNEETDPVAVSADERNTLLAIAQKTLPAGMGVISLNNWNDVKEDQNAVQVVNNVPIKGATYTIVLPAHWKRSGKVPVLLSGNGAGIGNNQRLWKSQDVSLITLIGTGSQPGRTGLIGAYSNAGGTESQGIDDHTYASVGAFFDFIGQNGGDVQHAVTAGGSRGGGTALMWAINPKKLPYTVQAIFADIPPTAYGLLSKVSILTYPNLGYIYVAATHDQTAYLYSSPNGPSHPQLATLLGTNDPAQGDANSPIGMADQLKGKVLVIGRGTHDAFFPLHEFLTFDRRLTTLGITHSTAITLGQGHSGNKFLADQLTAYIDALTQNQSYQPPPGRFLYIDFNAPAGPQVPLAEFLKNGLNADVKATPSVGGDLPFTAEIPALVGEKLPADISVCGKPGATFSYEAKDAAGNVWVSQSGTLDDNECAYQTVMTPDKTGDYNWTFTYNGQPIPSTNTPWRTEGGCGEPAITSVQVNQPAPSDINGSNPTLGFGVDQYSGQPAGCAAS